MEEDRHREDQSVSPVSRGRSDEMIPHQPAMILLALLAQPHGDAPADLEARWRREYPAAVERLEAAASVFTATGSLSRRSLNGKVIRTRKVTFARDRDRKLLIRDDRVAEKTRQPPPTDVICMTPELAFRLVRQGKTGPFLIEGHAATPDWEGMKSQFLALFDVYVESAYSFMGKRFLDVTRDPSFALAGIRPEPREGEDLVAITYKAGSGDEAQSGTVVLDPGRDWAIRSHDIRARVPFPAESIVADRGFKGEVE
jgi:hypothetical protein